MSQTATQIPSPTSKSLTFRPAQGPGPGPGHDRTHGHRGTSRHARLYPFEMGILGDSANRHRPFPRFCQEPRPEDSNVSHHFDSHQWSVQRKSGGFDQDGLPDAGRRRAAGSRRSIASIEQGGHQSRDRQHETHGPSVSEGSTKQRISSYPASSTPR